MSRKEEFKCATMESGTLSVVMSGVRWGAEADAVCSVLGYSLESGQEILSFLHYHNSHNMYT